MEKRHYSVSGGQGNQLDRDQNYSYVPQLRYITGKLGVGQCRDQIPETLGLVVSQRVVFPRIPCPFTFNWMMVHHTQFVCNLY